ncbi:MAG: hypothetical protein D6674_08225 [Acidobacteria bacterium]|jgi:hypothetical protein|nr:MAG: hypothetical protein D6674_08225 [Acidobacteriota bacterium]
MRFFVSSDIRKNKPLFYGVLFFLAFTLFFWLASWLHFYSKYGFSKESLFRYYFVDPQFPERISIGQLSEDIHVGLFLHAMTLMVLFSLIGITRVRFKKLLIILSSLSALLYIVSDLIIYLFGGVFLKLVSFLVYQVLFILLWSFTLWGLTTNNGQKGSTSTVKSVSFIFSLFSLLFLLSNFLNFFVKMGFGINSISNYYLGNPELLIKRKTLEGVFKVFYPHLVSMAIYVLTLSHLLPFSKVSRKKSIFFGFSMFILSSLDNFSSLLILYMGTPVAYLKLLSFLLFQLLALYASLLIMAASLRREEYPALYL